MANKIQIRRGLKANLPTLSVGELAFCTDTNEIFVGNTDGNKQVGSSNYVHPATHPATMITEDSTHRFVTDTEKSNWNGKAGTTVATTSANGLMSSADKTKLDGVATNANNYTHPANHPATMITEDSTHRFMTDAEKAKLNGLVKSTIDTLTVDPTTPANGYMWLRTDL